ncbi:recombinase family protein [Acetobacter malorum]|nr:recombinase family protein [Acetobacter malorum]
MEKQELASRHSECAKFGYVRPAQDDPSCVKQIREIVARTAISEECILVEKQILPPETRPAWIAMRKKLKAGDEVIVCDLGRLGRDAAEVLSSVASIAAAGCSLCVLDMPAKLNDIPLSNVLSVILTLANIDKELKSELGHALSIMKPLGGRGGSKPIVSDEQIAEGRRRINMGESVTSVAASLGLSRPGFYKRYKRLELRLAAEQGTVDGNDPEWLKTVPQEQLSYVSAAMARWNSEADEFNQWVGLCWSEKDDLVRAEYEKNCKNKR